MRKVKKQISGKRIAPGVIKVNAEKTDSLFPGQKVLLYKPTTKSIIGSSGRIIGKKELVLGVGEVVKVGDSTIVKLSQRSVFHTKNAIFKRSQIKQHNRVFRTIGNNNDVLIKPVEE